MNEPAILEREPLVAGNKTLADVNNDITKPLETFPTRRWYVCMAVSLCFLTYFLTTLFRMIFFGIGTLGLNSPVGWGTDIINFVFWIGIGHAGTLISAILFLFRQKWRTSINRSAEAMTIFAVMTAGLFPLMHTGRQWLAFFWLFPYPNTRGPLWINFRSPLIWDVFAVSTYLTISAVFWYVGLIPDIASVRDRAKNRYRKFLYGILSLGWRGSNRHWSHYESAYLLLAGLSTPLVLSVHTIVSFDFAVSLLPGWHTTIFPPYFVAGAIFSGFAMVVTLLVIAREVFNLQDYITLNHLEAMNKIILLTGSLVGYAYASEFFMAWYSGNPYERAMFINRAMGPYAWSYWTMISCNVLWPQLFWIKKVRRNIKAMFILSLLVNIGMWYERFVIIVTSLNRDFLPSSWRYYWPTMWDWGLTLGAFGMFFTLFLLFCRALPAIAMAEIKGVLPFKKQVMAKRRVYMNTHKGGVMAVFSNEKDLINAAREARLKKNLKKYDAFTPYPVHGLDAAMGIKRSFLPWVTLVGGLTGLATAAALEIWTSAVDWPLNVGGKPLVSFPAFVPIMFELTVLFGGLATVGALFYICGLPNFKSKPLHPGITNDKFVLYVPSDEEGFNENDMTAFLKTLRPENVTVVTE